MKNFCPTGRRNNADLWSDFWTRETGTGQQVIQLYDIYGDDDDDDDDDKMMIHVYINSTVSKTQLQLNPVVTKNTTVFLFGLLVNTIQYNTIQYNKIHVEHLK
jgi:hypothetical protein